MKRRLATLRVESPGLPARRNYHLEQNGTPIPAPTLIETVADILSSRFAVPAGTPPWDIRVKSQTPLRLDEPEVIWNHPDLSNLRIRRLNGDGAEEIIKVDLNAIIASSKATETPEEARRKDIQLQGGDILEIPLKGDSGGGWTGLDAGQADFFAKVLDCRLQFLSEKQEVELREMRYRPLSFQETEGGKYPFLPAAAEGTFSSTRVFDMLWMKNSGAEKLARDGKTYHKGQSWAIFARDGDQISWIPIDYNEILKGTTPKPPVIPPAPTGK
ncbi:MAG: hypothetical protein EOP87_13555 [Verrucomicrobiaceae bacterium]|nr:MAG: hypothetical protein EOP87_13555 [Verrucomicrobiaceae bacterium]